MKHTIASAILAMLPNARFNASDTYDSIQWDSDNSDSEDLSGSVPKTGKKRDPNSNPGLQGV